MAANLADCWSEGLCQLNGCTGDPLLSDRDQRVRDCKIEQTADHYVDNGHDTRCEMGFHNRLVVFLEDQAENEHDETKSTAEQHPEDDDQFRSKAFEPLCNCS